MNPSDLCVCGHSRADHQLGDDCCVIGLDTGGTGCIYNCKEFRLYSDICVCGHPRTWHRNSGDGCKWRDGLALTACRCEGFRPAGHRPTEQRPCVCGHSAHLHRKEIFACSFMDGATAAGCTCQIFQPSVVNHSLRDRLTEARRRLAPYLRPTDEPWSQCDAGIATRLCEVIDVLIEMDKEKRP